MWKPLPIPGKLPPFNDIAHLDSQALKFVCALRAPKERNEEDWLEKLPPEQRALVEAEKKTKKGGSVSSSRVCKMAECKAVFEKVGLQVIEKENITKRMAEVDDNLFDNNKFLNDLVHQLHDLETDCTSLQGQLDLLRHREKVELKRRSHDVVAERHTLEREIVQMEKNIEFLNSRKEHTARQKKERGAGGSGFEGDFGGFEGEGETFLLKLQESDNAKNRKKKKQKKKHTGIFDMSASGVRKWSCCNTEEDEISGCGDEHSIGVRSTLLLKNRESYHPYEAMQKELRYQIKLAKSRPATALPSYGNKGFRERTDIAAQSLSLPSMTKAKAESNGHVHIHNHGGKAHSHQHGDSKIHSILHKASSGVNGEIVNAPHTNSKSASLMGISVHFGANATSAPGSHQHSLSHLLGNGSQVLNERSISAGSLLIAANRSVSSAIGRSRVVGSRDVKINRVQGRPLTAHTGVHLKSTTTFGPASCLDSTCHRII